MSTRSSEENARKSVEKSAANDIVGSEKIASTLPAPLQKIAEKAPALARVIRFGWRLSERWSLDKCPLMAASMAFFGLLSIFPVLIAALTILGRTLADRPELRQQMLGYVANFLPTSAGQSLVSGEVQKLADSNALGVGVFAILSLLWSGRAFFDTLAGVLNSIWWQTKPRTFLQNQLVSAAMFFGTGALFLLSTLVSIARAALHKWSSDYRVLDNAPVVLWDISARISSFLLTLLMFWTIYRFLPNSTSDRRGRVALGSALLAAFGWEIAKLFFARFMGNSPRYGLIYGSVAGVVLLLMWLYLSSTIILFAAEVTAVGEEMRAARLGEEKPTQMKAKNENNALVEAPQNTS